MTGVDVDSYQKPVEEVSFEGGQTPWKSSKSSSGNKPSSSASSASTSSSGSTHRVRNGSTNDPPPDEIAKPEQQQEPAPVLETIAQPLPSHVEASRRLKSNVDMMNAGQLSPRSINHVHTFADGSMMMMPPDTGMLPQQAPSSPVVRSNKKPKSRRLRHQRTMSDGGARMTINGGAAAYHHSLSPQPYGYGYGNGYPQQPQQGGPPPPLPYTAAAPYPPPAPSAPSSSSPQEVFRNRVPTTPPHGRSRAYSGDGANGGMPLPAAAGQPQHQRRRSRHRKSRSSGPALSASNAQQYGSFWGHPAGPTAAASPTLEHPASPGGRGFMVPRSPVRQQSVPNGIFDPRNEILGLTTSLRSGEVSPVPPALLVQPSTPQQGGYRATSPIASANTSPLDRLLATPVSTTSGAEASFLAHKGSRRESSRGRHMRQHSAQLFMEETKGAEQTTRCRDVVFLLFFFFHLCFIVYIGNLYSKEALAIHPVDEQNPSVTVYYHNLLYIACFSGAFTIVLSSILLGVMTIFAKYFVQVALCCIITLSFMWGTIGVGLSARTVVPVTGIIALALSVAYTFIVWERIPFASANLSTALSAIRAYPGTVGVAFIFQALALGWTIYFCVVVLGVYDAITEGKWAVSRRWAIVVYVLLGISYYWTFQVLLHSVQTCTAGVVGHWWHNPQEGGVVRNSSFRAIFYSMGSICFGSLFVGPVRLIRQVAVLFRPASDEASLLCLHECLRCVQTCITYVVNTLANHFNAWAFTYIGLYGYGFLDAGLMATELFEKRGWTLIVNDDLVPNILLLTSLVLGGITGCFAFLLQRIDGLHILSIEQPAVVGFWIGVVVGIVLTSVLFGVISSSVNAVLICFAGSPVDFERNHPELSVEMRNSWREVWPGSLDVVDLRIALQTNTAITLQPRVNGGGVIVDENYPLMGPTPPPPPMVHPSIL